MDPTHFTDCCDINCLAQIRLHNFYWKGPLDQEIYRTLCHGSWNSGNSPCSYHHSVFPLGNGSQGNCQKATVSVSTGCIQEVKKNTGACLPTQSVGHERYRPTYVHAA